MDKKTLQFSKQVKDILKSVFGYSDKPVSIKGERNQIRAFVEVLGLEKKLFDTYKERGPDHPETYRVKKLLEPAIENFERIMEIEWPLKE